LLGSLRAKHDISTALVWDANGGAFARADFLVEHAHAGTLRERVVNGLFPDTLLVRRDIVDGGAVIGRIEISAHLYHLWIDLLQGLALMVPIAVGLSGLALHFGTRLRSFLIDPILSLAGVSHRVSAEKDYSLRAIKRGSDEVGDLVDGFNRMLAEIQSRDEALRQERASLEQRVEQRTADLRRAMDEATQANRVKSEFLSTVSHELRTPLTAMVGSVGLLAGGALGPLPQPVVDLLTVAQKNGQRLGLLIDDLLDIEKLMAGKLHVEMQEQPLMPQLDQALTDNRAYAERLGVRFVQRERCDAAHVVVDAHRLQQVMANLLSNAAKFSHAGAEVEIDARCLGNRVRVTVTDHGPGVPDDFRGRIFQKFSQADASDTRQRGGTGLGLAISRELIERMGGMIGFHSEPGQGASFYFELPLKPSLPDTEGHA
jgi:signal transduction histidine kinase